MRLQPRAALRQLSSANLLCRRCVPLAVFRPKLVCSRAPPIRTKATSNSLDQESNAVQQAAIFSDPKLVQEFTEELPEDIKQRLTQIAASVPNLSYESRVIDVGTGTGALIPYLRSRGVADILGVDLSAPMLEEVGRRYGAAGSCGNDPGVRTWCGDFLQVPAFQGPADAIFFNAVFGNFVSARDVLIKATQMLRPGGYAVISHPMGREWLRGLKESQPELIPSELPDRSHLEALIADLPLSITTFQDEPDMYLAVLQVPLRYSFPAAPLHLEGPVVTGFGRGSRQLGVPTANLEPEPLQGVLAPLPHGVYFGWAQLQTPGDWPAVDGEVHKMVMNIGRRPTVEASDMAEISVECHILHKYSRDFYGYRLRVVALGYIRPEMKFSGVKELVQRIRTDIGLASSQLSLPELEAFSKHDDFFILK